MFETESIVNFIVPFPRMGISNNRACSCPNKKERAYWNSKALLPTDPCYVAFTTELLAILRTIPVSYEEQVRTSSFFHLSRFHNFGTMSVDQLETFSKLSTSQQIILAILPIPSSILSVIGSTVIIYIARKSREAKGWNPYHRLLLGMSVCDIIFSITLGLNIFLLPRETSQRIWVMGNHATCSAMGFFIQFSYSALLYNAMLSFYFLLTARFGLKNDQISRRIEPIMHVICLGYPTITAWTGLFMDAYSESGMALGCWVKE